jgi:hypothetical protein
MATRSTRAGRGGTPAARSPRPKRAAKKLALWTCPRCGRTFRQKNQEHSCGVGSRRELLAGKREDLVRLYEALERDLKKLHGVEIVMRGRYALFRTTRIFADLVFMKDALRLAILLDREVKDSRFFKVGRMSAHRVAHVMKIRDAADVRAAKRYLTEAHQFAL